MAAPTHFSYRALGIIIHPQEHQILLVSKQGEWSLPQIEWETTTYTHWADVTRLNREMSRYVGEELVTLRCLSDTYNGESNSFSRVYVMELYPSAQPTLTPGRWIDANDLINGSVLPPDHRPEIEQWLTNWNTSSSRTPSVPWYNPGWFARITTWIEQQVAQSGEQIVDVPEHLRVGERGYLLRAKTTAGMVYFKALPSFFAQEIPLLEYLASAYPGLVPTLVAVDYETHSMLMGDFGGMLLSQSTNLRDVEEALLRYAMLQIDQVDHIQQLRELGCPHIPTETLVQQIKPLLADPASLMMNAPGGLSEEDVIQLRSFVPLVDTMCQQLADAAVPATLEHGDFHDANIAIVDGHPLYFDWTDACIAHPFFSLYPFLLVNGDGSPDRASIRQHLRDVYLGPWERYASKVQLVEIFELAQKIAPLYLATLYSSLIISKMDAPWEMRHGVPNNLRALLLRICK